MAMPRVRATISAGACGFVTEATAVSEDSQHVSFALASPCAKVQALAALLPEVDGYAELGGGEGSRLAAAVQQCRPPLCCGCVVPAGLLKAMQVAAGLALPQVAQVEITRE